MKKQFARITAAVMALSCTAAQMTAFEAGAEIVEEPKPIYVTDFEDGDVSKFSPRGDTDTSVLTAEKDDDGNTYMSVTERSQGWNGPQIKLDDICEPGVRYTVSVRVKAAWYNDVKVSLQYTANGADDATYSNLQSQNSSGEWVSFENVKFSFSEDVHDVFLYIESTDDVVLCVDDFKLETAPVYGMEADIPGLKDVYADYFRIGGAVTADELAPKSTKDLILKHYNSITLGNELKPENMLDREACLAAVEDDPTAVSVSLKSNARSILNFCRDNNIPVRGHVLVWHSQTPGWFFKEGYDPEGDWVDKETMIGRMENYIKGVFAVLDEEYPDVDFYAWDVVNEAWTDGGQPREAGTYEQGGEYSGWVGVFGDNSFIPYAFRFARKYARPETKLYYNDFNEYLSKIDSICEMAEELKAEGTIDGIGMQSHLNVMNNNTEEPFPTVGMYAKALDRYSELGLDIQITELDATLGKDLEVTDELLELQANYYSDLMDAIVAHKDSVSAVVFWGTTDDMSWRAWGSPLLFNEDYTAKPCFKSIIDGIEYTIPETTEPKETKPAETTEPKTTTEPEETDTTAPEVTDAQDTTVETADVTGDATPQLGDVNNDKAIDIMDVITLNKFLLGSEELNDAQKKCADVDGNGEIDTTDSLNVLKYVVEMISSFESL